MSTLQNKINTYLNAQGFTPPIQRVLKINACILCILFCITCVTFQKTDWVLWIFSGAMLTFFNFFFMALFIQKTIYSNRLNIKQPRSFLIKQIFLSNLRLFITGILLYTFIVILGANPFAIAIGLTVPLALIPIILLAKL